MMERTRNDSSLTGELASRVKFVLKFVALSVAGWFLLALALDLLVADQPGKMILAFLFCSYVLSALAWAAFSLGHLFFKSPRSQPRERLVNAAAAAGLVLGAMIAFAPMLLGGSPSGGPTPGVFLLLALMAAIPFGLVAGAILALKGNYPRIGDFIIGGAIGVTAMIFSMFN